MKGSPVKQKRSYRLYNNPITKISITCAITFALIIFILLFLDHLGVIKSPVLGLMGYILLPGLLIASLLLIPIGMHREWRRRHIEEHLRPPVYPIFDFNYLHQRKITYFFLVGSILLVLLLATVTYHMYEYTDSVSFCTDICHTVMKPEKVTYINSPHAHVPCVDCHVGSGVTYFVKSKFSGLRQVYAVLFNKYPRPIETPIENLRPASETCEHCHWPEKFFGSYKRDFVYYDSDENNSKTNNPMLLNVGGGVSPTGIHWHVDPTHTVKYIASDKSRQEIPYVEVIEDGTVTKYYDVNSELDKEKLLAMDKRIMDCIDCHNRPTHIFHSPNKALNEALSKNEISPDIPYIKKVGLEVLEKEYSDKDAALESIEKSLKEYYSENYSDWLAANSAELEKAISKIKKIYADNNFLHMKSNWKVYPNNIGHLEYPGCMRCHDGNHVAEDGKKIRNDCNICHVPLSESAM